MFTVVSAIAVLTMLIYARIHPGKLCMSIQYTAAVTCVSQVACLQVLQWTRDWGTAQKLAWRVASAYVEECSRGDEAMEGAREWLQALAASRVPCALVSSMSR